MREYAQAIRERVPMRELAERVGLEVNRQGYAACPFHGEKTPSLKIYDGTGGWHCFGCGSHGSVIDFAMQYYSLSFAQAVTRINYDFALGLPLGKKLGYRERLEMERRARVLREESAKRKHARSQADAEYWIAYERVLALDRWKRDHAPKSPDEEIDMRYVQALHRLPEALEALEEAEYKRMVTSGCRQGQGLDTERQASSRHGREMTT